MKHTWLLALVVAATAFAGCTDGGDAGQEAPAPATPARTPGPTPDRATPDEPDTLTIRGIVQDDDVNPIEGAVVRVRETGDEATTGPDGRFAFPDLPSRFYVVEADAEGYANATLTINPREVRELLFVLNGAAEQPFQTTLHFQGLWQCAAEYLIITPNCDEAVRFVGGPTLTEGESEFDFVVDDGWKTIVVDVVFDASEHPGIAGLRNAVSATNDRNELAAYEKYGDWYDAQSFTFQLEPGAVYDEEIALPTDGAGFRFNIYPLSHGYHPAGLGFLGVGVAVDVEFEVFATVFYVEPAPEGFSFVR